MAPAYARRMHDMGFSWSRWAMTAAWTCMTAVARPQGLRRSRNRGEARLERGRGRAHPRRRGIRETHGPAPSSACTPRTAWSSPAHPAARHAGGAGRRRRRAHPGRPQGGRPPDRRGRGGAALRPDHRLRHRSRSRRASTCTSHNCGMGDFAKDYAYGVDAADAVWPTCPPASRASAAPMAGSRPATTSASSPSVNCSAHVADLIADTSAQPVHRRGPAGGLAERRWRGGADPQDRLRHDRRASRCALLRRTLAGYARHANFSRHRPRPGLRGQPDRRADARSSGWPGACAAWTSRHGRHPQDGRRRHRLRARGAGRSEQGPPRAGARSAN